VPMVERLIESCRRFDRPLADVQGALVAFDLLPTNAELARKAVATLLTNAGAANDDAAAISAACVRQGDFLLTDHGVEVADFVLGNPPYVRLEDVPTARSDAYRRACPTMRGRSDIYVGFIETGLRILRRNGVLGFIVADRWMHNQYGADLRRMVTNGFSVEAVVAMHDVDAFEEQVSAYPAVTMIRRAAQRMAVVANAGMAFESKSAPALTRWVRSRSKSLSNGAVSAVKLPTWFDSDASWPSGDPANLALLADLESRFLPLENASTGTRVGIGVASGTDSGYLTRDAHLVEPERLLPVLTTSDTKGGRAAWSGTYLVNPWEDGRLVDLRQLSADGALSHLEERTGSGPSCRAEKPAPVVPHHRPGRTGTARTRQVGDPRPQVLHPAGSRPRPDLPPPRPLFLRRIAGTSKSSAGCCSPTSPNSSWPCTA